MLARGGPAQAIGMSSIKLRRIEELGVLCHAGTMVGDYVPFYFCPRSVMLYVIYRGNHPELSYHGGQNPIVHLEADLHEVVGWADANGVRWAFSLSNAGARYTEFRSQLGELDELDWNAIAANDFRDPDVKERKQSEFLVHGHFPFDLVNRIGVRLTAMQTHAMAALANVHHKPQVEVRPDWYF